MKRLVLAAAIIFTLGFYGGATLAVPARTVARAIDNAQQWETIALRWKKTSDEFERVAGEFRQQAIQLQDGFLVCNSMLPVEKRM